jgi:hypothetical protein
MDGAMNLEQALDERLKIINCTPADIRAFIQAHPPESRLVPVSSSSTHHPAYTCTTVVICPHGWNNKLNE